MHPPGLHGLSAVLRFRVTTRMLRSNTQLSLHPFYGNLYHLMRWIRASVMTAHKSQTAESATAAAGYGCITRTVRQGSEVWNLVPFIMPI